MELENAMPRTAAVKKPTLKAVNPNQHHLPGIPQPKFKELQAELEKLTRQLEHVKAEERQNAIAACKQYIEDFELSAHDLGLIRTQVLAPGKVKKSDKTFGAPKVKQSHRAEVPGPCYRKDVER
jgi:hypothetical protein